MTPDIYTLGATAVVAIMAFKTVEHIIRILTPKNNLDTKQETDIAILKKLQEIQGNDLAHMKKDVEEIKINVAEIMIKLDNLIT